MNKFIMLMLFAGFAQAQNWPVLPPQPILSAEFTWVNGTLRKDGSKLLASEIAKNVIYVLAAPDFQGPAVELESLGAAEIHKTAALSPGDYQATRVIFDINGAHSPLSDPVAFTMPKLSAPGDPGGLSVKVNILIGLD